jgi:hypothetical protein
MEPEQLLEMTELVPRPVLRVEVFRIHTGSATLGGLATSGECLQLHSRLPWKPCWRGYNDGEDTRLSFVVPSKTEATCS